MATILWCYLRSPKFKTHGRRHAHLPPISPSQANHLGVTIQADIIKQKLPDKNGGYPAVAKNSALVRQDRRKLVYDEAIELTIPMDLVAAIRWQLLHGPLWPDQFRR